MNGRLKLIRTRHFNIQHVHGTFVEMKTKQEKGEELMTSNYIRFCSVLNEVMIYFLDADDTDDADFLFIDVTAQPLNPCHPCHLRLRD